jgi:hypothetical protein
MPYSFGGPGRASPTGKGAAAPLTFSLKPGLTCKIQRSTLTGRAAKAKNRAPDKPAGQTNITNQDDACVE